MKLIKTKTGATLPALLGVGAVGVAAALALVLMVPVGFVQVLVLLLVSAALMMASALGAGEARGLWRLRVCGSAVRSAPLLRKAGGLFGLHASGPRRQRVAEASTNHPARAGLEVQR